MANIDVRFLRLAVLYLVAGLSLGIQMGLSGDHSMYPAHAHINLVGWVSFALYAVVYRAYPAAARSRLAPWHFWIANLGAFVLVVAVCFITVGDMRFEPVAGIGAIITLLGALIFGAIVALAPLRESKRADAAAE